ncbi:MAG TPA: RNA 2',3'-cyclic phosphodiesterase [Usitatibacter sp.]|nr:RNA 2',3'-cyclic phosphodiesterase [Usitatibacter sp.]
MARLFFAIWPGAAASRSLAVVGEALAGLAGGKPVPAAKIHMTLAFLGSVGDEGIGGAVAAASAIGGGRIDMGIDTVGSFRRARVGWAAPSLAVPALAALQAKLAGELRARGFALEEREFNPHATLVRKISRTIARAPTATIEWRSNAFTLVQSTGGRYEVLESWGLN